MSMSVKELYNSGCGSGSGLFVFISLLPYGDTRDIFRKYMVHPIAKLFREGVLNNPGFTMNSRYYRDWLEDCSSRFPMNYDDTTKSYFFWRETYEYSEYDYIRSFWKLFVLDGIVNHDYPTEMVPLSCEANDDETATDFHRRHLHERKEMCYFAITENCYCSLTGECMGVVYQFEKSHALIDDEKYYDDYEDW